MDDRLIILKEPVELLYALDGFKFNVPDVLEELHGSYMYTLRSPLYGFVGYLILEDKVEYQDLLFVEIRSDLRGAGFGAYLISALIDRSRPVHLLPYDEDARAFFTRLNGEGYFSELELEE